MYFGSTTLRQPEAFKNTHQFPYRAERCIAKIFRVTQIFLLRNIKQQIKTSDLPASSLAHFVIATKIVPVWTPNSAGGSLWSLAVLLVLPSLLQAYRREGILNVTVTFNSLRVSPRPSFSLFMSSSHSHGSLHIWNHNSRFLFVPLSWTCNRVHWKVGKCRRCNVNMSYMNRPNYT